MRNWIPLVFLALVVWQLIQTVLQAAAKKQEQQRLKELAERQRRGQSPQQSAQQGTPPRTAGGQTYVGQSQSGPVTGPGSGAARGASRAQTLADRRRAQLEELRARRQGRGGSSPRPVKATRPSQPKTQTRRSAEIQSLESGRDSWQDQQKVDKQRREASKRRRLEQQRITELKEAAEEQREDARKKRKVAKAIELEHQQAVRDTARPIGPVGTAGLKASLSDPRSLRQLYLLKEIIDPPVSMREPGL